MPQATVGAIERNLDSDARFVTLARGKLPDAYRLAGYLLGNAPDAEDAAQEALLNAWQGWPDLREQARFGAWFDRIVVNVCRNRLRGRHLKPLALDEEDEDRLPSAEDPFRDFIAHDELARLIAELEPDRRIVVVLRFWEDLSVEQIAERVGIPQGTVKSRLHYALGELRERAGREWAEVPQ